MTRPTWPPRGPGRSCRHPGEPPNTPPWRRHRHRSCRRRRRSPTTLRSRRRHVAPEHRFASRDHHFVEFPSQSIDRLADVRATAQGQGLFFIGEEHVARPAPPARRPAGVISTSGATEQTSTDVESAQFASTSERSATHVRRRWIEQRVPGHVEVVEWPIELPLVRGRVRVSNSRRGRSSWRAVPRRPRAPPRHHSSCQFVPARRRSPAPRSASSKSCAARSSPHAPT